MALRLGALHDALLHPGDAELAQKAAEEVADYQTTIHQIELKMTRIEGRLTWLQWMVATLVALQIALGVGNLWLTMSVLARLPR